MHPNPWIALCQLLCGFVVMLAIILGAIDFLRENGRAIARVNELGALKEIIAQHHHLGGKVPDEELTAHLSRALGIVSVPDGVKAFDLEGFKKAVANFEKAVATHAKTLPAAEAARIQRMELLLKSVQHRRDDGEEIMPTHFERLLELTNLPTAGAESSAVPPVFTGIRADVGGAPNDLAARPTVPAPTASAGVG